MNSHRVCGQGRRPVRDRLQNPPDSISNSLTAEYFDWVVQHMADLVIRLATRRTDGRDTHVPLAGPVQGPPRRSGHPRMTSVLEQAIEHYHISDRRAGGRMPGGARRRAAAS